MVMCPYWVTMLNYNNNYCSVVFVCGMDILLVWEVRFQMVSMRGPHTTNYMALRIAEPLHVCHHGPSFLHHGGKSSGAIEVSKSVVVTLHKNIR